MKAGFFYTNTMDKKSEIIERALHHFLRKGCKIITMNDIANEFSLSKKTLYSLFENKEMLLSEAVDLLWNNYLKEVAIIQATNENPIQKIVLIYEKAIEVISSIEPVFIISLRKHHQKVMFKYANNRKTLINDIVLKLLIEAQHNAFVEGKINLVLFCEVNFKDIEERIWTINFLEKYSKEDALEYFIKRKLRGILSVPFLFLSD